MPRKTSRLTTCSICGQPALAGGRLCAPCRAAIKRARDSTVSEAVAEGQRPRKLPSRRPPLPVFPVHESPGPAVRTGGPRLSWAIGAACLVVVGIVWFVHSRDDASAAASRAAVSTADAPAAVEADAGDTTVEPAPAPAAFSANQAPLAAAPRAPIDPRSLPSSIAVPRVAPREAPAAPPEPPPVEIAPPAPPPVLPPVVVAQAPPPKAVPDRWQRLSDQLAACPPEPFKRAFCQEALRIEHCEGYWGRVAPCPAKVEREYGN